MRQQLKRHREDQTDRQHPQDRPNTHKPWMRRHRNCRLRSPGLIVSIVLCLCRPVGRVMVTTQGGPASGCLPQALAAFIFWTMAARGA
jgi:hypothetical protein